MIEKYLNINYRTNEHWLVFTWRGNCNFYNKKRLGKNQKQMSRIWLLWILLWFLYLEYIYIMIITYLWSLGGEYINISIMNKFKQGMLFLWIIHMLHQDNLDQELGQNILNITHIQVEEVIFVQNQHQYMDQSINMILSSHTREVTSFSSHKQFLKD